VVLAIAVVMEDEDEISVILHEVMDTIHAVRTITTSLSGKLLDEVFLREGIGDGFILGSASRERHKSQTQREEGKEMFHKIV
jgi:hypothetical protein